MSKDASKKLYVCNRKRCRNCYSDCNLTSDVRFAAVDDTVVIADGTVGDWTPVEERLPTEAKEYLVTYQLLDEPFVTAMHYNPRPIGRGFYVPDDEWGAEYYDVLAWMPMPEPYERSKDE